MKDAPASGRRLLFCLAGTALLKAAIERPTDAAASEAPPLFGFEGQFIQFAPHPQYVPTLAVAQDLATGEYLGDLVPPLPY
jgi:hypothetical protein